MIYLKLFQNNTEYNSYTADTANFIKPNVSLIEETNGVAYHPYVETRVVAKYNVTDTSSPTKIGFIYTSGFSAIEIDGVVQTAVTSAYTFSTTGEHTVKYTLTDPTRIANHAFDGCSSLTSIDIPNSVTRIDYYAFMSCIGLTSITIPSSVTSIRQSAFDYCISLTSIDIPNSVTFIGEGAFEYCSGLTSIVCNATTAPTIHSTTFEKVNTSGTLRVPIGSSGYDVWMGTGDYYLGKYGWTKVEQ